VLAAVGWWLVFAAHNWGGRGPHAVSIGAGVTLVALLASRPDRHLGRGPLLLACFMSVGAFVVAATAPSGWQGATVAATYACVAWLAVAVAAEVRRRPETAGFVTGVILVATLVEFYGGWTAWHGGMDAQVPMSGTFYWYNPYAAFMLPGAIVGTSYWIGRRGPVAAIGLFAAILASISVVYSTSRASLACLLVGLLTTGMLHIALSRDRRTVLRAIVGGLIVSAAVLAIAGPPFFPHRSGPLAGTVSRGASQSLTQNGGYRLDFWREAIAVFTHHPLVGSGFRALASAANPYVPHSWPRSPLAHNGYLQAFSDGGLLLGVPLCLAAGWLVWRVLSGLLDTVRRSEVSPVAVAVPISLAALLAHSFVDFDWSYSTLFALTAILGGLILGGFRPAEPAVPAEPTAGQDGTPGAAPARSSLRLAMVGVGVATLVLSAYTARVGQLTLSVFAHAHRGL
jgi:O-antigen ligase